MQEKKYEFRRLRAEDMFTMTKIISTIGVNKFKNCFHNEEVRKLTSDLKEKDTKEVDEIGISIFLELAQVILEGIDKCKDSVYKLLSDTSNLSIEEIKDLDGVTFFEMLIDFFKKEEFGDFIKAASKLLKITN